MKKKNQTDMILKVLSLEDSKQDYEIICELLVDAGYKLNTLSRVQSENEYKSLLRSNTYDIILADFKLPGFDAFGALRWAKEICPEVPFICVSGSVGEETAIELIKAGADDYILKDRLKKLPVAIKHAIDNKKEIEKRNRAEKELERYQYLLKSSVESPKDMIILSIDREYKYLYFNTHHKDVMRNVYGSTIQIGMNLLECITSNDDRRKAKICYDRALGGESHTTIEEYGDLERYYYETRYNPIFNDTNKIIGATAFAYDVTERMQKDAEISRLLEVSERSRKSLLDVLEDQKRIEEALKISEQKYRSIFENVQDVYYETSIGCIILEVNPSIAIISKGQYRREDLLGKSMYDFYPDTKDRDSFIATILKNGSVTDYEIHLKNRDGSFIPCSISSKVFCDTQGNPEKIVGSMHDISERKNAENEIKQQLQELQDWYDISLGREERIIELKIEVNKLLRSIGEKEKYQIEQ